MVQAGQAEVAFAPQGRRNAVRTPGAIVATTPPCAELVVQQVTGCWNAGLLTAFGGGCMEPW